VSPVKQVKPGPTPEPAKLAAGVVEEAAAGAADSRKLSAATTRLHPVSRLRRLLAESLATVAMGEAGELANPVAMEGTAATEEEVVTLRATVEPARSSGCTRGVVE